MQSQTKIGMRHTVQMAIIVGIFGAAALSSASAQQSTSDMVAQARAQAYEVWHQQIKRIDPPAAGCFHASYPSVIWEKVACTGVARHRPTPRKNAVGVLQTVGDGNDYVAQTSTLTQSATGSFPTVTGVTSEQSEGAASGEGNDGANTYTLQLNTNYNASTAACNGSFSSCTAWEQFIYESDGTGSGEGSVYIQNWLLDYDWGFICPSSSWQAAPEAGGCVMNSAAISVPGISVTELANVKLEGSATANGLDKVTLTYNGEAYAETQPDSTVDIASVWKQSEFGIFGDGGGASADFNSGSSITVNLAVNAGSTAAPTCVANSGSTGETNNLTLGSCTTAGGSSIRRPPSSRITCSPRSCRRRTA